MQRKRVIKIKAHHEADNGENKGDVFTHGSIIICKSLAHMVGMYTSKIILETNTLL